MLVCFLSRVTGFAVAAVLFGLSFFPQRADSQEPAAQRAVLQGRSLHSVSIVNAARLALHARQGRMRRPRVVTNDDLPGESLPSPEVPAARPLEQASQLAKPEQPGLNLPRSARCRARAAAAWSPARVLRRLRQKSSVGTRQARPARSLCRLPSAGDRSAFAGSSATSDASRYLRPDFASRKSLAASRPSGYRGRQAATRLRPR